MKSFVMPDYRALRYSTVHYITILKRNVLSICFIRFSEHIIQREWVKMQ